MYALYLRKENSDYFLYLLGKNGEPKRNANIVVTPLKFRYFLYADANKKQITLTTNKDGRVKLGKITSKTLVNVNVSQAGISDTIIIDPVSSKFNYRS